MNAFEQAGEAMMLAEEGKLLLAKALVASITSWFSRLRTWIGNMPTTLPPTESFRRH